MVGRNQAIHILILQKNLTDDVGVDW